MMWKCSISWLLLTIFFSFLPFLYFLCSLCKVNGAYESSSSRNKSGESFLRAVGSYSAWRFQHRRRLTPDYPLAVHGSIDGVLFPQIHLTLLLCGEKLSNRLFTTTVVYG